MPPIEAEQWQPKELTMDELVEEGKRVGIWERERAFGSHITGLQETTMYGLKGAAAYACHARVLKPLDPRSFNEFHRLLAFLASGEEHVICLSLSQQSQTPASFDCVFLFQSLFVSVPDHDQACNEDRLVEAMLDAGKLNFDGLSLFLLFSSHCLFS